MVTRRRGDRGHRVATLQKILSIQADGIFGPATERAVEAFQDLRELLVDGVAGPRTWDALYEHAERMRAGAVLWGRTPLERVSLADGVGIDKHVDAGVSYRSLRLRKDHADCIKQVQEVLISHGTTLTTSGGTRSLTANVSRNRSATSRHYLGGAIDLGVYTGMNDVNSDPFVIERDEPSSRLFRVWARVSRGGRTVTANALDRAGREIELTFQGLDLTELMASAGFHPIPCRRSTWESLGKGERVYNPGGLEWWHFERKVPRMVPAETTWAEALLGMHSYYDLKGTPPWRYRHSVYGLDWGRS